MRLRLACEALVAAIVVALAAAGCSSPSGPKPADLPTLERSPEVKLVWSASVGSAANSEPGGGDGNRSDAWSPGSPASLIASSVIGKNSRCSTRSSTNSPSSNRTLTLAWTAGTNTVLPSARRGRADASKNFASVGPKTTRGSRNW